FYFTKDLFPSLGYLFGIGVSSFTDSATGAILSQNVFLLLGGIILALPALPSFFKWFGQKVRVSYGVYRYSRLIVSLALIFIATFRMAGNSFSPFLYWAF
ncbi:MAG: hypothetical protein IKI03_03340, partial [Clostridia bacterium]|nr:hypothetical protein [Clostridia bacterium]